MSGLTRDGTAEPVSLDQILRHARGQGNIFSLFSWPRAGLATLLGWCILCYMWWPYIHWNGDGNGDVDGQGDGDGAEAGTGVEANEGAQDENGDGSGDGAGTGTGTGVGTRRRTQDGNGDGNGDRSEDCSGDGNGDDDNGNENRIGEGGREAKKRKKPQNSCRRRAGNGGDMEQYVREIRNGLWDKESVIFRDFGGNFHRLRPLTVEV